MMKFFFLNYIETTVQLKKHFGKYVDLKEKGTTCTEEVLDKLEIRKYLHKACNSKANVRSAFEKFCKNHEKGKYKCSKSWKCKNIGCMGCIKHECIVEGVKQEIARKDVSELKQTGTKMFIHIIWKENCTFD